MDPAFDTEGNGTSADDHPLADIRLGERFIADAYHALASAGYLENTVLVVTFDEWGGFYDHVPPPHVIDDTNQANVSHTGDSSTPTDGQPARDANARDLGTVLRDTPRRDPVPEGAIPTSEQVLGPVSDAAAICGADSVQSVSPQPLQVGAGPRGDVFVPRSGTPTGAGMVGLGRELRNRQ